MSSSTATKGTNPYLYGATNAVVHDHQIRMEIVVEAKTDRVNVSGILRELMRRTAQGNSVTTFKDTHGEDFSLDDFPSTSRFADRLGVEQVVLCASKKVVLGFFVTTTKSFLDLKINIGFKWLQEQKVFLRLQHLPFKFGTDLSLIGYYIMEHPRFGNGQEVIDTIIQAWAEGSTSCPTEAEEERVRKMEQNGLIGDLIKGEKVNIPVTVERNKTTVKSPKTGKSPFSCDVWHVYVPRKNYADAIFLTDLAILEAKSL